MNKLFLVQDDDRPMYVVADSFQEAVDRWTRFVAEDNDEPVDEVGSPNGVQLVAESDDILWDEPGEDSPENDPGFLASCEACGGPIYVDEKRVVADDRIEAGTHPELGIGGYIEYADGVYVHNWDCESGGLPNLKSEAEESPAAEGDDATIDIAEASA